MRTRQILLMIVLLGALAGCGLSDVDSSVMPGVRLGSDTNAYVVCHVEDDAHLCALIAKELHKYGLTAETGIALPAPGDAGVLVTYDDTWTWDITTYLFTLRIDVRDPATNLLLATSRVSRIRFGSGSPEAMVKEAVAQLFAPKG